MVDGSDLAETDSGTTSDCEDITEIVEQDKKIYQQNITRPYWCSKVKRKPNWTKKL